MLLEFTNPGSVASSIHGKEPAFNLTLSSIIENSGRIKKDQPLSRASRRVKLTLEKMICPCCQINRSEKHECTKTLRKFEARNITQKVKGSKKPVLTDVIFTLHPSAGFEKWQEKINAEMEKAGITEPNE